MKIFVEMKDGERRVITIVPPVTSIHDGEHLSSFHCGDGTDHYFTPEGYYDGWGRGVSAEDNPQAIIEGIENDQQSRGSGVR